MPETLVNTITHDDGAIVEILLNRPDARNALSQALTRPRRGTSATSRHDTGRVATGHRAQLGRRGGARGWRRSI